MACPIAWKPLVRGPCIAATLLVAAVLAPSDLAGQWVPVQQEFAIHQLPALSGSAASPSVARGMNLPLSRRVQAPGRKAYVLVGLVAGGVLGYAIHEGFLFDRQPCDGDLNPLCPLTPYTYTLVGAAAGALLMAAIGSIREVER